MHRLLVVALFSLVTTASAASAQNVAWEIDPSHCEIGFVARHLAFAKVRGQFKTFGATITADAKTGKLASVKASAETASVDTDNEKRDDHLRSDDFFAASKFPKLTMETRSIKWTGDKFTAVVKLTLRGVTRDVTFEGEQLGVRSVNFGQGPHQRAAYEAHATIKRQDFGLNFSGAAEGLSIVGDEIEIQLQVEAFYKAK
jgi:polyisoprenoid-binding protein YceI